MKTKYDVYRYTGIPVVKDASGNYKFKLDDMGHVKPHSWRTGKHTKGKFKQRGQVFLTENRLFIAVITAEKMSFNQRHSVTPLQRFTSETINESLLKTGTELVRNLQDD
ncbi:DUF7671 family protein [Pediococcus damnosus]|uniref:DUF7671 domain-containing protein n=1 Tax=Pediococcus damnosus TaxID=51663 RepID=A0AAC9B279_9LACO|nr:Hypothetical protein ADU69_0961 [Pediococcus damnosus]AMV62919.1 Hypothetical protein ADU70_1435 [Pediococcus damnosus]AMV64937.1 Hypothetical protein ADU71_1039 [Pediococcus damnosus]AMV69199.1 Hypothetical protein ADU73_0793 [Pediococcus damnosus]